MTPKCHERLSEPCLGTRAAGTEAAVGEQEAECYAKTEHHWIPSYRAADAQPLIKKTKKTKLNRADHVMCCNMSLYQLAQDPSIQAAQMAVLQSAAGFVECSQSRERTGCCGQGQLGVTGSISPPDMCQLRITVPVDLQFLQLMR